VATPLNEETIRFVQLLARACFDAGVSEVEVGDIKLHLAAVMRPVVAEKPRMGAGRPQEGEGTKRPPSQWSEALGGSEPMIAPLKERTKGT
jgi:hypothetical protein